jgi:hypothetical protein
MFKPIVLALLCLFANAVLAAESASYSGVWQNIDHPSRYYIITEKDDLILFVNLHAIETNQHTLKSAYLGKKSDLVLTLIDSDPKLVGINNEIKLQFSSTHEGHFWPICAICGVVATNIKKVF